MAHYTVIPSTSETPMRIEPVDAMLDTKEALFVLGIHPRTLKKWKQQSKNISVQKIGNKNYYSGYAINAYYAKEFRRATHISQRTFAR